MIIFYRNPIKPRIRDSQVEGVYEDPEDGKIKKGNKWQKFPTTISLTDIINKPKVDANQPNDSELSFKEKPSSTTQSTRKNQDAVVFGWTIYQELLWSILSISLDFGWLIEILADKIINETWNQSSKLLDSMHSLLIHYET